MIQPLWKMIWRFLKKPGIKPPYNPAIPLLSIYPEEIKIEKAPRPEQPLGRGSALARLGAELARGTTGISGSVLCGAREVRSPRLGEVS